VNSWPESELGRVLRDYGEESNWYLLQNRIVKARLNGGLHSTGELVDLIRGTSPASRGMSIYLSILFSSFCFCASNLYWDFLICICISMRVLVSVPS